MTEAQLVDALGDGYRRGLNWRNDVLFLFNRYFINVCFSKRTGRVNHIGFGRLADVRFEGLPLFRDPAAIDIMMETDGSPFQVYDSIILLKLGITMTGFLDGNPEELVVTAFPEGTYDCKRSRLKRI